MAEAFFTNEYRVTFLPGEVTTGTPTSGFTACGPETAFPLLVTREQLAEILYRVKDAKFSGTVTIDLTSVGLGNYDYSFSTAAMETDYFSGDADVEVERSYVTTGPVNLDRESGMWTEALVTPSPTSPPISLVHGLITGMTHYAQSFGDTDRILPSMTKYHPYGSNGTNNLAAYAELAWGANVAWIDTTASGNPFDPGNQLYMQVAFFGYSLDEPPALQDMNLSSVPDAPYTVEVCDLTIELSATSLTLPLFGRNYTHTSTLTLTATEWWPYAKTGGAVWNTATGALL